MLTKLKRIAITGPESTGKSELAKSLAGHFSSLWVPEFAREYIAGLERPYNFGDILSIAKGQHRKVNELAKKDGKILFCDTELLVCKIWCQFKYGKCHDWILDHLKKQDYDLYLLTDVDLPWQPDPQREHPDKRVELFNLYLAELKHYKFPYKIVRGTGADRFLNALEYVNNLIEAV
jgi:NadR type nicotinamide-nucleotide adenylyltransferase